MKKIMITGATGPLGSAVIDSLLKKTSPERVVAMARHADKAARLAAEGVEVRTGDYDDPASLISAFKDIDKLYFVSGSDIAHRMPQHENVVRAAVDAGVRQVVYTSFQRRDETAASPIAFVADSHLRTEALLKSSGLVFTILQHGIYADMIPVFAGPHLLETKTLFQPAGDGRTAFAVRTDLAEAGANLLLDVTGQYDNQTLVLTGAEALTYQEVVETISKATGLPIAYHSPSLEEFDKALTAAGVPAGIIHIVAAFATATAVGEFDRVSDDLERLLGRKPVTTAEFLRAVYQPALAG
jgi:NAD(P)H dehydrogenase (quinone)